MNLDFRRIEKNLSMWIMGRIYASVETKWMTSLKASIAVGGAESR